MIAIRRISHFSWRCTARLIFNKDVPVSRKFTVCVVIKRNYCGFEVQHQRCLEQLRRMLRVSDAIATQIFNEVSVSQTMDQLEVIGPTIELLLSHRITTESIIDNSFLLAMKHDEIEMKLDAIRAMNPIDVNDFIPLMGLTLSQLKRVGKCAVAESEIVPGGHRIYFFSDNLNVDVQTMARLFVRNSSFLTLSFDKLKEKLRILRDYNVEPSEITKSFYILKLSEETLLKRLEQFVMMGISDIKLSVLNLSDAEFLKTLANMQKTSAPSIVQHTEILNEIHNLLPCSVQQGASINHNHIRCWNKLKIARENVSFLKENQIDVQSIVENPFLLTMNKDEIKERLRIVTDMKPEHIVDFLPLIKIETSKLTKIAERSKEEPKHRIYLFSERLRVEPSIVADAFANYDVIFYYKFELLSSKLDVLLSYGVPSVNILSCVSAFRHSVTTTTHKLQQRSTTGNETIKLSTLRGKYFNRLEQRRKNEMRSEEVTSYLVRTLAWTKEQTATFRISHPSLFKASVAECSKIIDFLLNDASYTIDDINNDLTILRCNLSEVKQRFDECKSLTFEPKIHLLRRSRSDYLSKMKKLCRDRADGTAIFESIETRVRTAKTIRSIRRKTMKTIDECEGNKDYLIERLAWSEEQAAKYRNMYPHLFRMKRTKLSETLDFLLNEASFTTDDINGYLTHLNFDLAELKCRFGECKLLGHKPTLYLLYGSPSKYLLKIRKICDARGDSAIYNAIDLRVCERKSKSKSKTKKYGT